MSYLDPTSPQRMEAIQEQRYEEESSLRKLYRSIMSDIREQGDNEQLLTHRNSVGNLLGKIRKEIAAAHIELEELSRHLDNDDYDDVSFWNDDASSPSDSAEWDR